jgi:hypothetical protein
MKIADLAEMYLRKWPDDQNLPGNVFEGVKPLLQAAAKQGWNREVTRLAVATIAARDLTYTNRYADQYAFTWLATNKSAAEVQLDKILGHGKLIPKSFQSLIVKAFSQELDDVRSFVRKHFQGEIDGYAQ